MANKNRQKEKWLISTSVALSLLSVGYFFLLFPKETTSIVGVYVSYIAAALIVLLAISLTVMLYQRLINNNKSINSDEIQKLEKTVSQIIWRNRYVLQSKKAQIMFEQTLENSEKWNAEKKVFAKEQVFLKVPESKVSFNRVSELIESSLRGADIGGIRPPTYSVSNIS